MSPIKNSKGYDDGVSSSSGQKIVRFVGRLVHAKFSWMMVVFGVLFFYAMPFIILGDDIAIRIHDTLDGRFSRLVSFAMYGKFDGVNLFNPSIMNGINDSALGGKFNLILLMFQVLDPLVAYAVNYVLLHIVGGIGAYLLLRDYLFCVKNDERYPGWMVVGCSLCFAFIPFFWSLGCSISGLPILLWAFLNLKKQKRQLISCFVIALMPFYSFLAVTGLFVLLALGMWLTLDVFIRHTLNKEFIVGISLMAFFSVFVEWNLVKEMFLQSKVVTHRAEWGYVRYYDYKEAIRIGLGRFVHESSHDYSLHCFTLLFSFVAILCECFRIGLIQKRWSEMAIFMSAVVLSAILCFSNLGNVIPIQQVASMVNMFGFLVQIRQPLLHYAIGSIFSYGIFLVALSVPLVGVGMVCFRFPKDRFCDMDPKIKQLFLLVAGAFIISMFQGFYNWRGTIPFKDIFPFFRLFQFDRFYCLLPLFWFLIFVLSLSLVFKLRYGKLLCFLVILGQMYFLIDNNSDVINLQKSNFIKSYKKNAGIKASRGSLTYHDFFSPELFKEIQDHIGRPKYEYRVVCIGMYPSIATYNGFFTLDGYVNSYPLEYKHKFRKIIENELNKSTRWREYFDNWGSRCYVFVSELDKGWFENQKDNTDKIHDLSLNTDQLKSMGGEYIFSSWEIVNAEQNKLDLMKVFERNDSPWRIYLYKVK